MASFCLSFASLLNHALVVADCSYPHSLHSVSSLPPGLLFFGTR